MEQRPDLPYAGKLGKLALQKNPASLQLAFGDKSLTPDMISYFNITQEYVKVRYDLDMPKVKADLQAGKAIDWAALKTDGCHLRIRK